MENGKWKMANGRRRIAAVLPFAICHFTFAICLLAGCQPKPPPAPKGYFGKTESMDDVVAAINANNTKLPTLWSDIRDVRVQFTDDQGKFHDEKLDGGNLLYRQSPRSLRLDGNKVVLGNVMQLGSNQDVYWLAIKEGPDTAWWGRQTHVGQKCSQPIPIQPAMLMEVLGITTFDMNFAEPPMPVMRFNNDRDAYTFIWVAPAGDRFIATREVWYDRVTKQPTLVVLYGDDGRVILRAYLTNHKPVEIENTPREQWPSVASEYDLFFPETKSKLTLRLGQVKLKNRGAPSQATFNFTPDTRRLGVSKVIQLDEACGP
jgi:hypothetical protein